LLRKIQRNAGRTPVKCRRGDFGRDGENWGDGEMTKHIKTINKRVLTKTIRAGGCGECQTSCQSACKTSCTVGNQVCRKEA
jgi:predicted ribosomally synthesized six-cysteine peptide SCIFF